MWKTGYAGPNEQANREARTVAEPSGDEQLEPRAGSTRPPPGVEPGRGYTLSSPFEERPLRRASPAWSGYTGYKLRVAP